MCENSDSKLRFRIFKIFFYDKFRVSELVFGSDGEQDKVRSKI